MSSVTDNHGLSSGLSPAELRRYARHLTLPGIGVAGQRRLKAGRVLCVGAGGLGSPVLAYLAAAGVGTLGVVDDDVVDESNLQRQVIHGQFDIGRPKVDSAADRLHETNPEITVVSHRCRIDAANALELIAGYDLVIDGTDNFPTRYLLNDACGLTGTPYIWGSIFQFDGQVSVFQPGQGPCYRCLFPAPPPPGSVPSCAEGGVFGVLCASIGSIQATEALKLLIDIGKPLVGRLLIYDALTTSYQDIAIRADPQCALCGENPTITELVDYEAWCGVSSAAVQPRAVTAAELNAELRAPSEVLLVDVRDQWEHDLVSIAGSVLVPKPEFDTGAAVAQLPHDQPVVVYCKSGVRSAQCWEVLDAAGYDVRHLEGGILAWIDAIAPDLPRY
jgi:sulfur-carrier protein adenylyltransferase/sulfurtransferase